MSSENLYVTVRAPLATLPLAKWTVICTYAQFWDSRPSRLASEHVSNPLAKAFGVPNSETGQVWSRDVARWCRCGLSVAGPFCCRCLNSLTCFRFHIPLIEPDMRISRITALGERSRCRPRPACSPSRLATLCTRGFSSLVSSRAKHLAGAQIPKICFSSSCTAEKFLAVSAECDGDDIGFSGDAFLVWPECQNEADSNANSYANNHSFGAGRVFLIVWPILRLLRIAQCIVGIS
jgi:hypothetical protein